MFLLSPQQLNRPQQTTRHLADNDVNDKMRAILNKSGVKPKKHDALLLRYLNLLKQCQKEEKSVKVMLQTPP